MRIDMAQSALSKKKELRSEVDTLLSSSRFIDALSVLKRVWLHDAGISQASWCLNRFSQIKAGLMAAQTPGKILTKRIYILRTDTMEPAVALLKAEAILYDLDLEVQVGAFNAFSQEILSGSGALYEFAPDVVILYAEGHSVRPDLYGDRASTSIPDSGATDAILRETTEHFNLLFQEFRSRSDAPLIVHSLWEPDRLVESGVVHRINDGIANIASHYRGIHMLDYNDLIRRAGIDSWWDQGKKETFGLPLGSESLPSLVRQWLRFIVPLCGRIRKVLVLDLDNTLWGGTIGEDGLDGISSANAFADMQKAVLELSSKGVILAIASKNNYEDAEEVFKRHTDLAVALDQFAAVKINWAPKSSSLQEIADELNLPLDALAFADNDAVEREEVRRVVPDVFVLELPDDANGYASTVLNSPVFSRLAITEEDRQRSRYYAEERQRRVLQESTDSLEDFLHSLQIKTAVSLLSESSVSRAAQLTQRTNQFNLTTKRYTEEEIKSTLSRPDCRVYLIRSSDRFGDNGITGAAITSSAPAISSDSLPSEPARFTGELAAGVTVQIDLFLLSCRVIGRGIETALLSAIIDDCKELGVACLTGWFLPTSKNSPALDFYEKHGFSLQSRLADGSTKWQLQLQSSTITTPTWIEATRA